MLGAGYKVNVIPGQATAHVDGRFLPVRGEFLTTSTRPRPSRQRESLHTDKALETDFDGALVTRCSGAQGEDRSRGPCRTCSPRYDAKSFDDLGIRCFGFAPLQLPPS